MKKDNDTSSKITPYQPSDVVSFIKEKGFSFDHTFHYVNNRTKFQIICQKHGYFSIRKSNLKNGGCQKCGYERTSLKKKGNLDKVIEDFSKKGWKVLTNTYIDSYQKLDVVCPNGHLTQKTSTGLLNNKGCRICANNQEYTVESLQRKIDELGINYRVLKRIYPSKRSRFTFSCNKGHIYDALLTNFNKGHRCPRCKKSFGEEECRKSVEKLTRENFPNKRPAFLQTENNGRLELDCYNEKLKLAIEYNGKQHYEPIKAFGGEESFKKVVYRDKLKQELCLKNNINLIYVPYYVEDIYNFIKEELIKLNIKIYE
jgi:hypothetical protein